uniref:Uncharacterized protein n=1 Tax=Oryza rufipogon TaxID=4529 RepID=A0A0E0NWL0_ORYRU
MEAGEVDGGAQGRRTASPSTARSTCTAARTVQESLMEMAPSAAAVYLPSALSISPPAPPAHDDAPSYRGGC